MATGTDTCCRPSKIETQLFIVDIRKLPIHPTFENMYIFRGSPINRVKLTGIVTSYSQSKTKTSIRVDDATGSINCEINNTYFTNKCDGLSKIEKELLEMKLSRQDPTLIQVNCHLMKKSPMHAALLRKQHINHEKYPVVYDSRGNATKRRTCMD